MPTDTLNCAFERVEHVVAAAVGCVTHSDDCLDTSESSELLAVGDPKPFEFSRQGLTDVWEGGEVTQSSASWSRYSFASKRLRALCVFAVSKPMGEWKAESGHGDGDGTGGWAGSQIFAPQYLQWTASRSWPPAPHSGQAWVVIFLRVTPASSTETMPVGTAMIP